MKKIFVMMIAALMTLTAVLTASAAVPETFAGEWSAMGYYDAKNDTMNVIDLDALILKFEGDKVDVEIFDETGSVNFQETVTYEEGGYLTFAPDGVKATGTFVVFPIDENTIGAYESLDGAMFEAGELVDFYMLQPREMVERARAAAPAMEAFMGEWSATGYYSAENDSMNVIDLEVLTMAFDGMTVDVQINIEDAGVRYQEIVTYEEGGYLTFAPDGEIATGTFVVFQLGDGMLGAYESLDGTLFAEDAPVDYYVLQPADVAAQLHVQ